MQTVFAFLLALSVLIAVHEYGHYKIARLCGVRVLRFSIGMGKVLWQRRLNAQGTQFVLGAFPIGGYVKMLDEREAPVDPSQQHEAFNTKPLWARAAIVAAGPLANLLLAVLIYAALAWIGGEEPRAVLATPPPGSLAHRAGVQGGETVHASAIAGEALQQARSFEDLRWRLMQAALRGQDVQLQVSQTGQTDVSRVLTLPLSELQNNPQASTADAALLHQVGIFAPWTDPVIADLDTTGPAAQAGLQKGDRVLMIGDTLIADSRHLRDTIRASVQAAQPLSQDWRVQRAGQFLNLRVTPSVQAEGNAYVGRVGVQVGGPPAVVLVRAGPLEGLWHGLVHTWEVSAMSVRVMAQMLVGNASLKSLSGPLTIADYAGKSASLGVAAYLSFLALVSISLGTLNLLPLPVLDGGHLMYYLWEFLTGKAVSGPWLDRLQRLGVAMLLALMSIALFNDIVRLLG